MEESNKTEEILVKKPSQQQSEEDTKKQVKPSVELQEEAKPESPKETKEVSTAEGIKWDEDVDLEQEEIKQDITQAATTQEPSPPQEDIKEDIKFPAAELGKESTLPEPFESQSAQYEELSSNTINTPEAKLEEMSIVEQTGISAPQNIETVEDNTEIVQSIQDEGQTERGGDNAEPEPTSEESKHESDTASLEEEKNEAVDNSSSIVPEFKKQSPISELLLSMERKLEEEKMRVHELELENQECNTSTKDR